MGAWPLPADLTTLISCLATPLHGRLAWRLLPLMAGALFAHGRRTVASWLRGASLGHDYKAYYYFLGALGRKCELLAALLLRRAIALLAPRGRLLFALDDTPTKRYGKQVEGAGVHHNPTPGPADHKFFYGHVWVTLAWVVRHPCGALSPCHCAPSCTSAARGSGCWSSGTASTSRPSCSWPLG
jgi:hypothetical protein